MHTSNPRLRTICFRTMLMVLPALLIASCTPKRLGKEWLPVSDQLNSRMLDNDSAPYMPILIRIFKKEYRLEVWKAKTDGAYFLLKTYTPCFMSGSIGPKKKFGDYQVPEGFYLVYPKQMNPNSQYFLSIDLNYPNPYDQALQYTGNLIMIHGGCKSVGCIAMTNIQMGEIYGLFRDAFIGGQEAVQVEIYPFRMQKSTLLAYKNNPNYAFWNNLKKGYDIFMKSHRPAKVQYTEHAYKFSVQ